VDDYLQNKSLPIWMSLAARKTELYRDIRQLVQGHCPALEEAFQCAGPFWGRYYFFWHDQKPLTLIYEVFSPAIQRYLNSDH
jgi:chorismate lyase